MTPTPLRAVRAPTVEELAAQPDLAADLPPEVADAISRTCVLALAAITLRVGRSAIAPAAPPAEDRLLPVEDAAARLGVSRDWLYKHARTLPFTVRVGPRQLRFSVAGLERWMCSRQQGA
jgi:predicted DNA-binding transcriptional regulator AlpA